MKKNRYFIITGASRGLGRALASELARDGASLLLIARSGLKETVGELRSSAAHVWSFTFDLTRSHGLKKLMDVIFKEIDMGSASSIALINNAGIISPVAFAGRFDTDGVVDSLSLNCIAPIVLANTFIDKTRSFKGPKVIVNVSSGAAKRAIRGWSLYCSGKSAVEMFTGCVAIEQSGIRRGVKVFTYDPGVIDTGMQEEIRSNRKKDFPDVGKFIKFYEDGVLKSPRDAAKQLHSFIDEKIGVRR